MTYKSNINTVMNKLSIKLMNIQDTDKLLQTIAVSLATSNTRRIHNETEDVSGAEITFKPTRKTPGLGAYSKSYAKKRDKKGRQISRVDFSFTGQLSKDFVAQPLLKGWGVGFVNPSGRTPTSGKIHEFLEKKYGNVWGVTKEDEQAINRIVSKAIRKELR